MKHLLIICALIGSLSCGFVRTKPPTLNPTVATAVTVGLSALYDILKARPGIPPAVFAAITDAQQAIAADISGKTWGDIIRQALVTIYSQLPVADQNNPTIAAIVAGLEAALATVGA